MDDLVLAKLIQVQAGMTDRDFSARLGISRAHWGHIRAGRRSLTRQIITRAVKAFPEILPVVVNDLVGTPT